MTVPSDVASLQPFVDAGVLNSADTYVTATLMRASGIVESTPWAKNLRLATALAVRAPRQGHVCVDLESVAQTVVADTVVLDHEGGTVDPLAGLKWPDPGRWVSQLLKSGPLVRRASSLPLTEIDRTALVLDGTRLYLDRYYTYETVVGAALRERAAGPPVTYGLGYPAAIDALFGTSEADHQRSAALAIASRGLTVVVGGPGTGKTRTVARALFAEVQAALAAGSDPRIALAAPTGKAAARLDQAISGELTDLSLPAEVSEAIALIKPTTIHRLLGYRNGLQFRHDARNRIPHDLVIIDEASMVSLPLMARLLAAVRPKARLVFVGDPMQLASVEAGAVLGDMVRGRRLADSVVRLTEVHRFGATSGVAQLAAAVVTGDVASALRLLETEDDLQWVRPDDELARSRLERTAASNSAEVVRAALAGDGASALEHATTFKVLCATRFGPLGLRHWQATIERLTADVTKASLSGRWYAGRPVTVTRNDYLNQLSNGDVGVVVKTSDGLRVQIAGPDQRLLAPSQLEATDTWWAMTIHKSQGSEFDNVVVSLPDPPMPILTRELLYTAVTRAKSQLTIYATAEAIRTAIETPITRTSGLELVLS